MNTKPLHAGILAATIIFSSPTLAQNHDHDHMDHTHMDHKNMSHEGHVHSAGLAPISIMGDHMHKKGEWMLSFRRGHMDMEGNRVGTNEVSPEEIVTNFSANSFSALGTNRVVPTDMTMDMHMFGAMYGATDNITLMLMGKYISKEMDHVTFAGGAGTTRLGTFTTESSGFGDTSASALVRLYDDETHHIHLNMGVSAPTGDIDREDDVLAPNGATPTFRLPYAMQLGSGTWDLLPGITYAGSKNQLSWGAQYQAVIRLENENDEGYSWGDRHSVNAWAGYQFNPALQFTARASYETMDEIDGRDTQIAAPVQTADPNNYGGDIANIAAGVNFTPRALNGQQIGFEVEMPVYQDLNGPQMERDWALRAGWVLRF